MRAKRFVSLLAAGVLLAGAARAVELRAGDVVLGVGPDVVRFDPLTGASEWIAAPVPPSPVTDVAYDAFGTGGSLLVTLFDGQFVWGLFRVDPATGASLPLKLELGGYPSVAIEPDGNVVVFDGAVAYRLDPTGAPLASASLDTSSCVVPPGPIVSGVAIDPSGPIYAVTAGCEGLLLVDFAAEGIEPIGFAGLFDLHDVAFFQGGDLVATRVSSSGEISLARRDAQGIESFSPPSLAAVGPPAFVADDAISASAIVFAGAEAGPKWAGAVAIATWEPTVLAAPLGAPATAGLDVVPPGIGPRCDDGLDNDRDGGIDHDGAGVGPPDSFCVGKPNRKWEDECGLGGEAVLLLSALRWLRRRARRTLEV